MTQTKQSMTPQLTDTQLKQALAKMLPNQVEIADSWINAVPTLYWISANGNPAVLDTELLHLCWMVEEANKDTVINKPDPQNPSVILRGLSFVLQYHRALTEVTGAEQGPFFYPDMLWHASWQQRVIALCKVKGVEIV